MENPKIDPARLPELYEAISQLNASLELNEVINRALQAAIKLAGAEYAFIKLRGRYTLYTLPELEWETKLLVEPPFEAIAKDVAQNRQAILILDTQGDPRFATQALAALYTSRTLLIVPVQVPDELLGMLIVDRTASVGAFTADDLATLAFYAGWAALAIYQNGLYRQYVSLMTHEFRTPLLMIRGYAELMLRGDFGPLLTEQRQCICAVYRSAYKMAHWLDEYLDIARIENELLKLEITNVDLQACISEITAEKPLTDLVQALAEFEPTLENSPAAIAHRIRAKQQTLSLNISDAPLVRTDRNRVLSIIEDLLKDAARNTTVGGRIDLTAKDQDTFVKLAIHIQKQHWFPSADIEPKIIERIIPMMGGAIGFESEPGKGSTFWFTLLTAEQDSAASS